MTLSYRRYDCSDVYFSDADLQLSHAVKFDLYEGDNLVGTLISNYRKSWARFKEGKIYRRNTKSIWEPIYEHIVYDESEIPFARITYERPFFGTNKLMLAFYRHGEPFIITHRSFYKEKDSGPVIDIKMDQQIVFTLKNTLRPKKLFYDDTTRTWQGTIEMRDDFHKDKVFGFLLAIQIYYWSQDAASSS